MKIFIIKKTNILMIILLLLSLSILPSLKKQTISVSENFNSSKNELNKIQQITNQNEKIAYLTFDDGPSTTATAKILDILKEENIKATFFVIGKKVVEHPELVKRTYEEGHFIANHTYNHNNSLLYKNNETFLNEIKNTDIAIGKAIGVENYTSHVFRFPNGFMSPAYKTKKKEMVTLLSDIDYTYIDWNCLNNDSIKKYSSKQLVSNFKKSCKDKGSLVILMHDTTDVSDSSSALKDSIQFLKSEGYSFKNFYEFI